jgi:NhaP-type Na+/H+ or K+/H+ antiporter
LWEIAGSIVVGIIVGFTARWLLKLSIRHKLVDKESFLVFSFALALLVTGSVALLHSDDLFAVFIAGNAFSWDGDEFMDKNDESHIHGVVDMVFNISFFVIFGAVIPWAAFAAFPQWWRLPLAASLLLVFRRLPGVFLLRRLIPALQTRKEAFFAGWFGPMGVGAIFFAIQARDLLGPKALMDNDPALGMYVDQIFPIVSFVVLSSIFIHGITVPLTNSSLKRRMKIKAARAGKQAANLCAIVAEAENIKDGGPGYDGHAPMEIVLRTSEIGPFGERIVSSRNISSANEAALVNHSNIPSHGHGSDIPHSIESAPTSQNSNRDSPDNVWPSSPTNSSAADEYVYVTDDEDEDGQIIPRRSSRVYPMESSVGTMINHSETTLIDVDDES